MKLKRMLAAVLVAVAVAFGVGERAAWAAQQDYTIASDPGSDPGSGSGTGGV
ncbi:MAG TPA: hypothetical protein VFS21_18760 [Roseiflexaceae bacterium]|nr:hypothetical protein [Roseiflexaceae bacterium]